MKLLVLAALVLGQTGHAAIFPDGNYMGTGKWTSGRANGQYDVELKVSKGNLESTYTLPDGSKKGIAFEFSSKGENLFDVLSKKVKIGQGYCLNHVDVCHYSLNMGSVEETFVIHDGKFYRYGSKLSESNETIMWQEALEKK